MNFIKRPRPQAPPPPPAADFLNLILFGETGVGKSTLVNLWANLLAYDGFEAAQRGPLQAPVATSFTMVDRNFNSVLVEVGQPARLATGASVTQSATSYYFDVNAGGQVRRLHVIDTPGVGDTGGIMRDQANFDQVIEYLKQFDGLNAICILLKPNDSRLTLQFRYCFKELLVKLNRGTAPNICFCYTNARGTFFRPGEGYPLIQAEIAQIERETGVKIPLDMNNTFCFDSEAFRYLAAASKRNMKFEAREVDGFRESWDQGAATLKRLVAYSAGLPHTAVKSIYVLNQARKLLMELSKPVAEISRNIQVNKKLAADKKSELERIEDDSQLLVDQLYVDQVDLSTVHLSQPKTVCHNAACVQVVNFQGQQKINYTSDCHAPCYLDNVHVDVIAHPEIKRCHAFGCGKADTCSKCTHSWMEHLHVTREFKEVLVQVLDPNVQAMIDQKKSGAELIKSAIRSAEEIVAECEREQALLIRSSARLAKYVKHNGILYYNPDLEEYLNLLIKEEERKRAAGGSSEAVLDGLRAVKSNFLAEVDILKSSLENGLDEIASEADIERMRQEMLSMKLNGAALTEMLAEGPPVAAAAP